MNYLYYLTWDHPRRGTTGAYTGRFVETRWSPEAVILSAAQDLSPGQAQILRCAQDDTSHLAGSFPTKPTRVRTTGVAQRGSVKKGPSCSTLLLLPLGISTTSPCVRSHHSVKSILLRVKIRARQVCCSNISTFPSLR